jgi:hypothetical protein
VGFRLVVYIPVTASYKAGSSVLESKHDKGWRMCGHVMHHRYVIMVRYRLMSLLGAHVDDYHELRLRLYVTRIISLGDTGWADNRDSRHQLAGGRVTGHPVRVLCTR